MTQIYLIRHGTTDYNLEGRFQGSIDIPLNAQGREQCTFLARRFREIPLAAVYTSPLERAVYTAQGLCEGRGLSPLLCAGLREVDGGLLEGGTGAENELRFPAELAAMRDNPAAFAPPGGESTRTVYERVQTAMAAIAADNAGRTVAAVAHGFVIQTYLSFALGEPFEQFTRRIVGNTAVSLFTYEKGAERPTVAWYGDDSHLPERLRFGIAGGFLKKEETVVGTL